MITIPYLECMFLKHNQKCTLHYGSNYVVWWYNIRVIIFIYIVSRLKHELGYKYALWTDVWDDLETVNKQK